MTWLGFTVFALAAVAAGIAHELNNPLAVMASRIELMLTSDQDLSVQTREDLASGGGGGQAAALSDCARDCQWTGHYPSNNRITGPAAAAI